MKKLMLLMVGSTLVASVALAQNAPEAQPAVKTEQAAKRAEWDQKLVDELKLTAEQTTKFDALSKEYKEKIEAALADASLTEDARKEKKMALKKEKETKFLELLTPDQQAKYKELVEKKKKEAPAKPEGN